MLRRTLLVAALLVGAGTSTLQAGQAGQCPGGVSSRFVVTGDVKKQQVFDLDQLTRNYVPAQENVTYFAAGSVVTESFCRATNRMRGRIASWENVTQEAAVASSKCSCCLMLSARKCQPLLSELKLLLL